MSNVFIREGRGIKLDDASNENCKKYIQSKIDVFVKHENYMNKDKWLDLLSEISAFIVDDLDNARFSFNGLECIIEDIDVTKRGIILYHNIGFVLGNIVFNVFDEPCNQIKLISEGYDGAIVTRNILEHGYKELVFHRRTNNYTPAYGANFIFSSLIEEELKTHIKRYYSIKYLNIMKTKINNNEIVLTQEEDELFDYLCCSYEIDSQKRYNNEFDELYATGTKQFELLDKYTDISNNTHIEKLFNRTVTLNQLREELYFKNIVDDRFTDLLKYLFSVSNLNLRNNLAHSNLTYINYHYIGFASVLFLITHLISNEFFYK